MPKTQDWVSTTPFRREKTPEAHSSISSLAPNANRFKAQRYINRQSSQSLPKSVDIFQKNSLELFLADAFAPHQRVREVARKERVVLVGTDQWITSGPAAKRTHSRAEYMTAPERFADSQIPLPPAGAVQPPGVHRSSRVNIE
jgi:hypothetical protein